MPLLLGYKVEPSVFSVALLVQQQVQPQQLVGRQQFSRGNLPETRLKHWRRCTQSTQRAVSAANRIAFLTDNRGSNQS